MWYGHPLWPYKGGQDIVEWLNHPQVARSGSATPSRPEGVA